MRLNDGELSVDVGVDITYNAVADVCVFGALAVSSADGTVRVDAGACTGCSACISRCPAGAITLGDRAAAVVQTVLGHPFEITDDVEAWTTARSDLASLPRSVDNTASASFALTAYRRVVAELAGIRGRTPAALLVRNLLYALGAPAKAGVTGDTSSRFDLVFRLEQVVAIAELEQGSDLLDTARRLFANVAIARARLKIDGEALVPVVVCGRLPNRRAGYYELVDDAEKVIGLRIATVPLGALIAMALTGVPLTVDLLTTIFQVRTSHPAVASDVARLTGIGAETLVAMGMAPER